ncbi:MAG: nucleotide sugar dehydrogenase [Acidimicrobiia bacterium]|nr:nucleotide sugar dehydrogenase [Acidimicrobiia bacterium]
MQIILAYTTVKHVKRLVRTLENLKSGRCIIEIYGLGYVGFPLAVRLASVGLRVRGIDINMDRLSRLQDGQLMGTEIGLSEAFGSAISDGRLVLADRPDTWNVGKIGIICVPTPIPTENSDSSLHVEAAVREFLKTARSGDILIMESSTEVGTTDHIAGMVDQAGHIIGKDLGLALCPERIDPQNTRWTLANIPRVIWCSDDTTYDICARLYTHVNNSELRRVSNAKTAEVVKSFENAFRLVNISLVNELAILCDGLGISVHEVIGAAATKPFGFMPFYPSAGAGGHCIPKDPIFLVRSAQMQNNEFPSILNALRTNHTVPHYVAAEVGRMLGEMSLPKSVLVFGMAYKPNTEDMRDSPGFKIATKFINMGYKVGITDPFLDISRMSTYMKENHIINTKFTVVPDLAEGYSCLCICQHHAKSAIALAEAYRRGLFPLIYDCQGRLMHNTRYQTRLEGLGGPRHQDVGRVRRDIC